MMKAVFGCAHSMRKNIPFHYVDLSLKFREGNSTRKEDTELDQWIRQDPRHLELFEKINLNWQSRPQHRPGTMQAYTELASRLRSEEHTSELQSLMRISYAVFCLKQNKHTVS